MVYARDMWPRGLLAVAASVRPTELPEVVVWPQQTAQVQQVVHLCRRHRVPLVPFGAGSGVCGGAVARGGVVMDLKRMRRVLAIDPERSTVTFEPGILGTHLEGALARHGLTLGHFPSSIMCSTAGGWLATRSAGQCSTRYGKIEDMVQEVELVAGTGEVLVLRGDEPGLPDLLQLAVGSEGTLGIITRATCAVRRAPQARCMRGWSFPWVQAACEGIRRVLQHGLRPAVVRIYDELDTLMSGQRRRALARAPAEGASEQVALEPGLERWLEVLRPDMQRARRGLQRWLVSRALARPQLLNRMAGQLVPRLAPGCMLIVGFEGEAAVAEAEERAAAQDLLAAGGHDLGPGPGEHWLAHRYDISFQMPKAYAAGAFVDTLEVAADWERLLPLYEAVREAVSAHALVMAHFSHAYPDGCSIYFTFAARRQGGLPGTGPEALEADERRYDALWQTALQAVVRAGGTISHHHGIGRLKAPFMHAEHGRGMALYRALKAVLDPDGILNPGKMGLDGPAEAL